MGNPVYPQRAVNLPAIRGCRDKNMSGRFFVILILLFMAREARTEVVVHLTGIKGDLKEEVLNSISLERQKNHPRLTDNRIRTLFERAHDEIRNMMRAHGYYRATVTSSLEPENQAWIATYHIDPGEPLLISEIRIEISGEGQDDPAFKELLDSYPLQEGRQLNHGVYEEGKKEIQKLAFNNGYFDGAWIQHTIDIDLEAYSAVVIIVYDTGPRYRFGEIDISETLLSERILGRYMNFKTGDPYDADLLISLQNRLRDSGYFRDVEVKPELSSLDRQEVPVTVNLELRPRNAYNLGLGFGTDTGPRLVAGWENRYFNNKGHRANADLRLSPVLSSLTGAYLIPFFRDTRSDLGIRASLAREDTDTSDSNIFRTGIQHHTTRWGWNETISLSYQFEDFDVGDESRNSQLLMPGITYSKTVSDSIIYTTEGFRLGLDVKGAAEGFISDVSFIQATLQGKYITSLGDRNRLIARGDLGATAVSDFDKLPATLRFFAGGDNSIRGFDFKTLGPVDASGEVIGGKYLAVGSVELERRIFDKWSVAAFTDFGNAFDNSQEDIEHSAGAGVRWQSPIGLIRLDLAVGVSDDDLPLRLHFVIGPDL